LIKLKKKDNHPLGCKIKYKNDGFLNKIFEMKYYLQVVVFLFCLFPFIVDAQEEKVDSMPSFLPIEIIGKHQGSSIKLRWAINDPMKWYMLKDMTYDLYRAKPEDGKNKEYKLIKSEIGVASLVELESKSGDDLGAATVYSVFYDQWETQKNPSQYSPTDIRDELETKFLVLLYSCDLDFETAKLAGMGYEDKTIEKDVTYIYRLAPSDKSYLPEHKIVEKNIEDTPLELTQWAENENHIVIGWDREKYEGLFSGFYIEKSDDGVNYIRQNDIPYIHALTDDVDDHRHILWSDSVSNYDPHYYRILGVDAFGDLSEPSNSLRLQGKDRTPPLAPTGSVELAKDQSHNLLRWDVPTDEIDSYIILKSNRFKDSFTQIGTTKGNETQFVDTDVNVIQNTFYKICAVDSVSNYSCTEPLYLVLKDDIPPAAPTNFEGSIDSNGVVLISWDLGSEPDLHGYHVQVSNGTGRVFTAITEKPIKANFWRDTIPLEVLTEDIYYRIVAEDYRNNMSDFSEVIRLLKPDIVPPNASIFKDYSVGDSTISIHIICSTSRDLEKILLQRKSGQQPYETVFEPDVDNSTFIDSRVNSNSSYTYQLITYDDAGNSTISPNSLFIKTKKRTLDSPSLITKKDNDITTLEWDLSSSEVDYIKLYKIEDSKLKPFKTISGDMNKIAMESEEVGSYRIRAFYENGRKSPYSNTISIEK